MSCETKSFGKIVFQRNLFATSEGDVLAIGNNNHGQCGNDCSLSCGPTDTRRVVSLDHEFVTMVAASANSSFALTQSGKVYRFGLIHAYENSGESNEEKDGEEDECGLQIAIPPYVEGEN